MEALKEFITIEEPATKFDSMHDAGEATYMASGGMNVWQQAKACATSMVKNKINEVVDSFADGIKGTLTAPLQVVSSVEELFSSGEAPEGVESAEPIERFEEGVVYLMGQEATTFNVGQSYLALDTVNINIKTPLYRQLGFEKKEYSIESEENKSWFDTILDGAQLALDIVGCIPGIGEVADLVNAGISLARGDYYGAAASLIGCIPGIGDAAKVAMKGAKAATKAAKALNTIRKIVKVTQAFLTGAGTLNTLLTSANALKQVFGLIAEGKFSITNREHVDLLIQIGQSGTVAANHAANKKKKKEEAAKNKSKDHDADSNHKSNKDHDGDNKPVKKQDDPNGTKKPTQSDERIECPSGADPINLVTGSFLVNEIDMLLEDIVTPFTIERSYESIYTNTGKLLGSKWLINIESSVFIKDNEAVVLMPDTHIEKFEYKEGSWINQRAGDVSYTLIEMSQGYLVKCLKERVTYAYNRAGQIETIIDKNNNQTLFTYKGDILERIDLASGQYLVLEYADGKLSTITDTIGRQVKYRYEGDLLVAVTYANGGVMSYTYTSEGYIETITDRNEITYVHNQYDHLGRVTRQVLADMEEYILLYDESNRTNTLITMSKNQTLQLVYTKDKLITKTIYEDGTYTEVKYDDFQNHIYERDRNGNEIYRRYNQKCQLLEEALPNGLVTYYEYNEADDLERRYDNAGGETRFIHDSHHNLIQKSSRLNESTFVVENFKYDARGRRIETSDPSDNIVKYKYDKNFSRPTVYIDAEDNVFEYAYDEAGRNMALTSEYGTINFAYNHHDHQTLITDEQGHTTKYEYDKMGNLIKEILPNDYDAITADGASIRYSYNALGQKVKTIDQLGNIFALTRNTEGKVTKEIHPNTYDTSTKDGEGITYIYDKDDRCIKIIYPDGGIERTKYDANGNIIKIIQPEAYDEKLDDGPGYTYLYDAANQLVQITAPDGVVQKRFVYDLKGYLIKEIDAKGYLLGEDDTSRVGTLYTYNLLGWLLEERVPVKENAGQILYKVTQYTYSLAGDLIKEKRYIDYQDAVTANGRVHTISYVYDKARRLTKVSDCTGAVIEYRYDSLGQRTYERKKINEETYQITNYKFDGHGHILEVSQSADQLGTGRRFTTTKYTYDPNGNLIKIVTPKGYIIERTYDAANRLIVEKHLDQVGGIANQTTFDYDAAGNITAVISKTGEKLVYTYDLMNRECLKTDEMGGVTCTLYNKNGQIIKQIQPMQYAHLGEKGAGLTYSYDLQGQIISVKNALEETIEENHYNEAGELIAQLNGMKQGAYFTYDLGGRREKVTTVGGASQGYTYDARGNITGIIDGKGQKTTYQLDKWGRIIQIHKADASKEYYSYDFAGNITTTTDSNDHTITYKYNTLNKLSEIIDQVGAKESFIYNEEGQLLEHTNRNGIKVHYDYNMYGSLLRRKEAGSNLSESYIYYPNGRLSAAIAEGMRYDYSYYPNGALKEKKASGRTLIAYDYDLNGNKISQTDVTGKTTKYCYNLLDELTEIIDNENKLASYTYYPDGSLASFKQLNGLETLYQYDNDRNLTGLEVSLAGKKVVQNGYTYDKNGNRLEKQQLSGNTSYHYDALNHLTKVQYPTYTEVLFYDHVGNRIKRKAKGIEELYHYDARNRLTQLTTNEGIASKVTHFEYDAQGNLLKDDKATYSYDGFNRTQKVTIFDGHIQINYYDAEGLRHEIEENGQLVQFIFNTNREVVVEKTETDTIRLIRGYDITASQSEQARTYYHYVADELGSTTHIFEDKEIRNRYEYDAFGNLISCEEQVHNRFKYTGQQQDPITQQYYLRARYYNPIIARFTQEDEYRGDGLNLYAYCSNNPITYYDPSGFAAKAICTAKYEELKKKFDNGEQLTREEYKAYDRHRRLVDNNHMKDQYGQTYRYELATGANTNKAYKEVNTLNKNNNGPVIMKVPTGSTNAQIKDMQEYVAGSNEAIRNGYISPTGRVPTKGTLRQQASSAAKKEKNRAKAAGIPYKGHPGHVPDTTWTGNPVPYKWLDMSPKMNTSAGGQSNGYPIGYKPTEFIMEVNGKWIIGDYI